MAHPQQSDIDEIVRIFYDEMLMHATTDREEQESMMLHLIQNHTVEDIMGIHAHYHNFPWSHRRRYHHETVQTLRQFYEEMFDAWDYPAKLYHSLAWLDVGEQTHNGRHFKVAAAAMIYEGIYVPDDEGEFRRPSVATGSDIDVDRRTYHCHMSAYTMRKEPAVDENWRVFSVLGGLAATGYEPKIDPRIYPDDIPEKDDLRIQKWRQNLEDADVDRHDVAFFVDVNVRRHLADAFYGWEVTGNLRE